MASFFEMLAQEFEHFFVIMLIDRAGWHLSRNLRIPENIRLIPQPVHSPELNPVEYIWYELQEKYFNNRALHSLNEIEDVLCHGINFMNKHPEKLKNH
jgi:transposase